MAAPSNPNPASLIRPAPPARVRPYRGSARGWLLGLPALVLTGVLLFVVSLGLLFAVVQWALAGRALPGVSVAGIALGGMDRARAAAVLPAAFPYAERAVFTLQSGARTWSATAAELGVALDIDATLDAAFAVGRAADPLSSLGQQAAAWQAGHAVPLVIQYDRNAAASFVDRVAAEMAQPVTNPQLIWDGASATVIAGQPGMAVDREAALAALDAAILRLESDAFIELAVSEIQPAVTSVEAAAEKLGAAVSGDLHLVAVGENGEQLGPWTATAAQISEVLSLQLTHQADGTAAYTVDFDAEAFRAHLETLAPGLVIPPRDARFRFNPAIGALELHRPAVSGRQLDIDETLNRLADGVFQRDNRTVPMAFVYTLPRYHNQITAQELGIRELVGQSTTTFQGSGSNRRTNIAVSASRIDGVIIAPGEEFSFNNVIGDISPEAGYLEDKLIFGGRTVDGVGGGVCQLSTTVFRGALVSGFPIIERNSHGYRVGYYEQGGQPPGLDAAIWQPERDLRFLNDTPYHLLIEIDVFPADDALQIRLYSTNPGRVVEIEAPIIRDVVPAPAPRFEANSSLQAGETLQVDYAAEGADVTVYRNIYGLDGELITRDHIYTHYLPWGAIYQVAPTDSRLANTG